MRRLTSAFCLLTLALSVTADAKELKVSGVNVTATSTLPPGDGVTYYEKNLVDGKVSTVWVEGDTAGSGLGTFITIDLGGEQDLTGLRIWNGHYYSYDFWNRHNRVKDLEVTFSDGTSETFELKDEMSAELITFAKTHKTTSLKLKIKGVHRGTTFNDTVISELQILDDQPSDYVAVASYKASSVYPADADGSYEPERVADGVMDTMWCENSKDGDGKGEWLEFDFGKPTSVSKLYLVNGNGYSPQYCLKANRAVKATLAFSDGSTQQIDLKTLCLPQTATFSPTSTSKVKVTFDEIKTGTDFNDLCISEARFAP
ncbi:MAG: discoidin domain-containing protein [Alphaproteobacteria bacterium]|nr:discoidin domain-containing protein [Alphaproteobacteria bacterium]